MKKFLSAAVVVVAVIFSASSQPKSVKPVNGELWFQLKAGGDANKASDYAKFGNGSTAPTCSGSSICAKLAMPDSEDPTIPVLETAIDVRYRTNP